MYTDFFSIQNIHGVYDCVLEVLERLCIELLLIVAVCGKSGSEGRETKGEMLFFSRHVLFIIKLKYMFTTGYITTYQIQQRKKTDLLTGTSFLKLTPVGLVTVTVLATVVVVEVVTIVLT